ncbi:hypothetical protein [Candidatus Neptunochlamydia vexilliferae]|uniref:hypothetical protein n=1 Tax=Candidatus Neptunichlamydia vexilliferae TaxID=1651774 RepID=UPI00189134A6|nr:hypothetical protein [Candidatus Neptunochlamydia vexilliferae]
MTILLAIIIVLLCMLGLGIGHLLKSQHPLKCKRCGNPEKKECDVCHDTSNKSCK